MGKKTRDAVSFFQNNNGINPSGRVDEFTHTLLYAAFKEKSELSDISDTIVTNQGFPLSKNMQNNDVLILNTLLDSLLKTYPNIERVNVTEYFDTKTERAVKDMQKILGFKENGTVDKRTFSRLWKENRLSNESHFGKMR
jgi:peptidoglycan hydrolase-like protein with peptidoglycan-binding domain